MRVEPHTIGSFMHILKRGARGLPITKDEVDRRRFARLLYFMNDEYSNDDWERETKGLGMFGRPMIWSQRKPLVKILAWVLMPNHFHLLVKVIKKGGLAKFMQKLSCSMSTHANLKYKEKGSLFQGSYRGKNVAEDRYLRYLAPYIMTKNVFELYPKGFSSAVKEFNQAWNWAIEEYRFSSLADYAMSRSSPIIDKDILGEIFDSPSEFCECARDMVLGRRLDGDIEELPASFALDA